jgi:hypothetical protein
MPIYILTITLVVLGLFASVSVLPVLFSEKDFDSLVFLPR